LVCGTNGWASVFDAVERFGCGMCDQCQSKAKQNV
jgi:hypothetical protein